jgi:hypothetical protein
MGYIIGIIIIIALIYGIIILFAAILPFLLIFGAIAGVVYLFIEYQEFFQSYWLNLIAGISGLVLFFYGIGYLLELFESRDKKSIKYLLNQFGMTDEDSIYANLNIDRSIVKKVLEELINDGQVEEIAVDSATNIYRIKGYIGSTTEIELK